MYAKDSRSSRRLTALPRCACTEAYRMVPLLSEIHQPRLSWHKACRQPADSSLLQCLMHGMVLQSLIDASSAAVAQRMQAWHAAGTQGAAPSSCPMPVNT